jgi:hypothetical protein
MCVKQSAIVRYERDAVCRGVQPRKTIRGITAIPDDTHVWLSRGEPCVTSTCLNRAAFEHGKQLCRGQRQRYLLGICHESGCQKRRNRRGLEEVHHGAFAAIFFEQPRSPSQGGAKQVPVRLTSFE